jgi:hypothetical protein
MFTILEIVLIVILAYLLIGIGLCLFASRGGVLEGKEIAVNIFLWIFIIFYAIYLKLNKITE